jgi:acyl-CoA reductase-like NAD-dependent aldehyde dehydrogenase
MISEGGARRATDRVDEAAAAGAKVLCGGTRQGSLMAPTLLISTRPEMGVNCLEVFARWSPLYLTRTSQSP